ncbi:S41 family peptidase [Microaerobacter geothermalis]|uniref:S41 family peptidase n=1 Tax=Microaerobacter geothermalis TaxID=674972 RepID=UPI001F3087B4|nr:S41 family peptidase [Microaerobacter geothermalis]MCF6093387.1 S41 family peptidase [Microaerobacter geothermalis]
MEKGTARESLVKRRWVTFIALTFLFLQLVIFQPVAAAAHQIDTTEQKKKLNDIFDYITQYHVSDIDPDALLQGAIKGMLDVLGDKYTNYFSNEEYEAFINSIEGSFTGVGMYVDQKDDYIIVQSPIKDSPAEKAGLQTGDKIIKVNDEDVVGQDIEIVTSKIKGVEGTTVTITVLREGVKDPLTFTLVRQRIQLPLVESKLLDGNIGYLQVYTFGSTSGSQFKEQLKSLEGEGAAGYIIDLRNNPGGLLDAALSIIENFVDEGPGVIVKDGQGREKSLNVDGPSNWTKPIVVLVNENSASASEIVAGALKDYGVALVVGTQSFGKGTVQQLLPLESGGVLKLTIEEYFTPNRVKINGVGVTPDLYVTDPEQQLQQAKHLILKDNIITLDSNDSVQLNGINLEKPEQVAVQDKGEWFVSLRKLSQLFGGKLDWDGQNLQITYELNGNKNQFSLNDHRIMITNGTSYLKVKELTVLYPSLKVQNNGMSLEISTTR